MEKPKKERSANFTAEESRLLLRLTLEKKDVLESKATNSGVNKVEAWDKICKSFNANAPAGVSSHAIFEVAFNLIEIYLFSLFSPARRNR